MNKNKNLLPWYINHSLSNPEKLAVESWLQSDREAEVYYDSIQQIAGAIGAQKEAIPSYHVRARIIDNIRQPSSAAERL